MKVEMFLVWREFAVHFKTIVRHPSIFFVLTIRVHGLSVTWMYPPPPHSGGQPYT